MSEDKSFLKRLLTETWPARMAQDALRAVMLPGDVYQGKVSMYGDDGRTNPEVINRSADLAGMVTLGAGAVPAEANSLRSGIKAYHGSPHDFERFDLSKIGTGEGAQAYGHGLYFADNEGVAKSYRDTLSRDARPSRISDPAHDVAQQYIKDAGGDRELAAKTLLEYAGTDPQTMAIADYIRNPPGSMYEVNIRANPDDFLDWDKPLSEQPAILDRLGYTKAKYPEDIVPDTSWTGSKFWAETQGAPNQRTDFLKSGFGPFKTKDGTHEKSAGIPGIKYLDQGSRGAGEGSRNYVVFDDNLIDILKKYGLAGASASPLAALMAGQGQGELQQ